MKSTLLKGIKKRPGTAPPPELAAANLKNEVRMVYINSGQAQLEFKVSPSVTPRSMCSPAYTEVLPRRANREGEQRQFAR